MDPNGHKLAGLMASQALGTDPLPGPYSYYYPSGSSFSCKVSLCNAVVECSQSAAVGPALAAGPLCERTQARRPAAALHSFMLPSALGSVAAEPL